MAGGPRRASAILFGVNPEQAQSPESKVQGQRYVERLDFLETSGALDQLSELRKESRELDTLINDAAGLFALTEVQEMLGFVTSRLLDRFIPLHLVFLIDPPDGGKIEQYSYRNLKPDDALFPSHYFPCFRDFFTQTPYSRPFSAFEEKFGTGHFGSDIRAYAPDHLFPMIGIGGLFGVVILGAKMLGGEYSSLERMYADRLLRFLSIALQNRIHRERSITDPKTGLYNHGYFARRLEEEISRIGRSHASSAIIMLDVDNFKKFNDTWGHLSGDDVLIGIAGVLRKAIRGEDVASRFGGEEFCILLVDCGEGKIFEVAERIRMGIEDMEVRAKHCTLKVTASFGCCPLDPSWKGDAQSYIERADQALYRSKAMGRNRTTLYRFGLLGRAEAFRNPVG
jgi:diguanylate cyclase (GGDEF)-like protein